jgi:hypothetical protein
VTICCHDLRFANEQTRVLNVQSSRDDGLRAQRARDAGETTFPPESLSRDIGANDAALAPSNASRLARGRTRQRTLE